MGAGLFDLSGKLALVTGCSRGIGHALSLGLAQAGADVIGVSRSLQQAGEGLSSHIQKLGQRFYGYECDLKDRDQIYKLTDTVLKQHKRVDILIHNAGIISRSPAIEHSDASWDEVLAVNTTAAFILSRELAPPMIKHGTGRMIFVASLLSFQGGIKVPSYSASKGAVAQLVKALANEWSGYGVCVNGLAPGYIATDNTKALRQDPKRSQAILERIPAGRWGKPEDLVGAATFLASPAAEYVHGSILTVDGGWMAR